MNESLKLSDHGLVLLKELEQFSSKAYYDFKGYSTGFGHLIKQGEEYLMKGVTPEQAEHLLINDVIASERLIHNRITIPLNQYQFDACVIMAFNIPIAFTSGSIDDKINSDDPALERTWKSYNKVRENGKLLPNKNLTERRTKEWNLYNQKAL